MLTMLMYHRILPYEHPQAISTAQFNRQLDYLEKHYCLITPEEVLDFALGKLEKKHKPFAALSFDDGWCDNHLFATSILKERGLRALLAVSAGYLYEGPVRQEETPEILNRSMDEAQQAAARGDFRSYASIEELKAMQDSGAWRLEIHGTAHVKGYGNCSILAVPQENETLSEYRSRLRQDIENCRKELISKLNAPSPQMFFWPWGHYSQAGVDLVREMGLLQFTVAKGSCKAGNFTGLLPRLGVSPRWKKFRRNCFVFRHPLCALIHDLFHTEKVCFDDTVKGSR